MQKIHKEAAWFIGALWGSVTLSSHHSFVDQTALFPVPFPLPSWDFCGCLHMRYEHEINRSTSDKTRSLQSQTLKRMEQIRSLVISRFAEGGGNMHKNRHILSHPSDIPEKKQGANSILGAELHWRSARLKRIAKRSKRDGINWKLRQSQHLIDYSPAGGPRTTVAASNEL